MLDQPVLIGPLLYTVILFGSATAIGAWPIIKLIRIYEAKHELKEGSAGFIRSISGWSYVAFWIMATWFFATILGDWLVSGDPDGAVARAWLRLRILLEIAAALAESD